MQRYRFLCTVTCKHNQLVYSRFMSALSKPETKFRRNELFDQEKAVQRSSVGRIEKIKVIYQSPEEDITMLMNKNLSTPHDCAKHISEGVATLSALATVNDVPWDMHKPLVSDCQLKLHTMKTPSNRAVNNSFWRTCSFILGAVIDSAFKDNIVCHLHSFTAPNIKSGSFIYDAHLELPDWNPTPAEMKVLSAEFAKLINEELSVERLEVNESLALEMFTDNRYKSKQIPDIAKNNDNKIVLYRIGDHIDISKGPMVANTNILGRCTVTAVHKIQNEAGETLYRFQGLAIPKGILINHFIFSVLEERASKLNETVWMPHRIEMETDVKVAIARN